MKPLNRFIKRFLIVALPILCYLVPSISLYLALDPFSVVRDWDNPYEHIPYIAKNKDYVSSYLFDKNNSKYNYNSFILGNSRSIFYPVSYWKQYIGTDASPFHYDASGDDIVGISAKLKHIDKQNNNIDNVLIILDHQSFNVTIKKQAPQFNRPHQVDLTTTRVKDQLDYLISFVSSPKVNIAQVDYLLFNKERDYMGDLFTFRDMNFEIKTNEISFNSDELLINKEPEKYYTPELMKVFYVRDSIEGYAEKQIFAPQEKYIKDIMTIFKKHDTEFKIIINPLYDQKKIDSGDLKYLKHVFGSQNVYDFSGKNSFTEDYRNYYEWSHYRPHIAKMIIDSIYNY